MEELEAAVLLKVELEWRDTSLILTNFAFLSRRDCDFDLKNNFQIFQTRIFRLKQKVLVWPKAMEIQSDEKKQV